MNSKTKKSIRLSLSEKMHKALEELKHSRYPFMKDDEIIKLAFSKLYSHEFIPRMRQTSVEEIIKKINEKSKDFGEEWLQNRNISSENLSIDEFVEMVNFYYLAYKKHKPNQ